MDCKKILDKIEKNSFPDSYETMIDAYGHAEHQKVKSLYVLFYKLVWARASRNFARYCQGMYVLSGSADPAFVKVLWEALSHISGAQGKPRSRTTEGKFLEDLIRSQKLQGFEKVEFELCTAPAELLQLCELAKLPSHELVKFFNESKEDNSSYLVKSVMLTWSNLSHTQEVEKTFSDYNEARNGLSSGRTNKRAGPTGFRGRMEMMSARVAAKRVISGIGKGINPEGERPRRKDEVVRTVSDSLDVLTPSQPEIKRARKVLVMQTDLERTPRLGIPESLRRTITELEGSYIGWQQPRKTFESLVSEGKEIGVPLEIMCSVSCLKRDVEQKKGSPGLTVSCAQCLRSFHVKCMQKEEVLDPSKKYSKDLVARMQFMCQLCKEQSVGVAGEAGIVVGE
jgi:hypothetical protein